MITARSSAFDSGGGDMGARLRSHDWAATPLGPLSAWPAALRITVDQMLASKFPACLFWGPDLIAVYNDGYRVILGGKPDALGQPMRETWAEVWPQLEPIAERALAGESTFIEDFPLTILRHGEPEDTYFTFNYGPVFDEHGAIVGMLDTVIETTAQRLVDRRVQEQQERQQFLLQQMPGFAAVLSGPEHRFDYVNDAYVTIGGMRDYIGRGVREVFPELAGQGFYELLDRVYQTGEPFRADALPIHLTRDDGNRYVDLLYAPMRDARGEVQGIFVGGYDTTDRVRAEAELRRSESRLRALNTDLEQRVVERTLARGRIWQVSPELLCVVDGEGRFEAVNPAWQRALGWSETELTGAPFREFVHPDDMAATMAAWIDASEHGLAVMRFENRYRARDGRWHWLSWEAIPEDGRVYCTTRDITQEKEHAAALAQRTAERDVLAAIVHTTDMFIQVLDMDYRFLAINPANALEYERIFGKRPAVGDSLVELLADLPEHQQAALAVWRRALQGESFSTYEEFGDPARERRHYEMRFEVLRASDGRQIGAFLTSTDVTERLREQRALADAQEALRQAQKMEAVGQLTGGIAHDFNNLLAAISGSLQVMTLRLKQGRADGLDRYLDMASGSVRRAASLTQRLLAFSRRQTLDPKAIDPNRLVQGMVDLIARTAGPAITIDVQPQAELWATRVDPSQLENTLLNLCINARDAMPSGGTLTVTTRNETLAPAAAAARELPPGDYVCLSVRDTGTGMSPEVVQRVFDPFFTTKPMGQGTGLGLSMVYGFVRQSGGQIQVVSRVGHGTTMRLYLPAHAGAAEAEAASAPHALPTGGDGETVLLIEDEEALRQLVHDVLTDAGYAVLTAEDGPTGLRLLQSSGRIDLLLTDVGLPGGMNGRQVADAGRAIRPGLKVLFITGYAESAAVGNGLMEEGMGVLTKPFEIDTLAARVRAMLDLHIA